MQQRKNYKPGDLVWVKMKSFPWWPAQVVSEDEEGLRSEVLEEKKPRTTLVRFFGEDNHCWSLPKNMIGFRKKFDTHSKLKTKGLQHAIKCALKEEEARGGPAPESEPEEEEDEAEPKKRKRAQEKKEDAPKRTRTRAKAEPKDENDEKDEAEKEEDEEAKPQKRARGKDTKAEPQRKKPRIEQKDSDAEDGAPAKTAKNAKKPTERATKNGNGKTRSTGASASPKTDTLRRRSTEPAKDEKKDDDKKRREDRQKRKEDKPKERTKPSAPAEQAELNILELSQQLAKAMSPTPPPGCDPNKRILHLLRKLDRGIGSVTLEDLQKSGLGKLVRRLTKKRPTVITELAESLLKALLRVCQEALGNGEKAVDTTTTTNSAANSSSSSSSDVGSTDAPATTSTVEEEEATQQTSAVAMDTDAPTSANGDTTILATPATTPASPKEEQTPVEPSLVPTETASQKEEEEPRAAMDVKAPVAVPAPAAPSEALQTPETATSSGQPVAQTAGPESHQ